MGTSSLVLLAWLSIMPLHNTVSDGDGFDISEGGFYRKPLKALKLSEDSTVAALKCFIGGVPYKITKKPLIIATEACLYCESEESGIIRLEALPDNEFYIKPGSACEIVKKEKATWEHR